MRIKRFEEYITEKFISMKTFNKLKEKNKEIKDADPYGEENWVDEFLPSVDMKDYDIWFKLKKDFHEYKKNSKFDCMGGLITGITSKNKEKINFIDKQWFEPVLKTKKRYED